jgi:hypothetical protein
LRHARKFFREKIEVEACFKKG